MDNKFEKAQLIAAYKRLFLTADGKHVLDDLAIEAGFDRSCFDPDSHVTAYQNGRRDLVLEIFRKLNVNITEYLTNNVPVEDY